jgi:hypothetical protein
MSDMRLYSFIYSSKFSYFLHFPVWTAGLLQDAKTDWADGIVHALKQVVLQVCSVPRLC